MSTAIVFDLDETLLDTSALRDARDDGRWDETAERMAEVEPLTIKRSTIAPHDLPRRVQEFGYSVGMLTRFPYAVAVDLLEAFDIAYDVVISHEDLVPQTRDPTSWLVPERFEPELSTFVLISGSSDDLHAAASADAFTIGTLWSRDATDDWRRRWPDIAVARPERLLDAFEEIDPLRPLGEALLDGVRPRWHAGTLVRVAPNVFAAGAYFTTADWRHARHRLSHLVLDAKSDPMYAEDAAAVYRAFAEQRAAKDHVFDLVTSVPPRPDADYDRFEVARIEAADALGAYASGNALRMRYDVPGYKYLRHEERAKANANRFEADELDGERVLLLEDVLTIEQGGQAETCADVLLEQGASHVTVLALGVTQDELRRPCPKCDGTLRTKNGRYGRFVGCSSWQDDGGGCGYTFSL